MISVIERTNTCRAVYFDGFNKIINITNHIQETKDLFVRHSKSWPKKKAFSEISQNHKRPGLEDIQTITVINYLETYPLVNTPVVNDIFASPFSYTTCGAPFA
mgnify:CR=1 FL=1